MRVDKSEYTGMKIERGITSRIGSICRGARFFFCVYFAFYLVSQKRPLRISLFCQPKKDLEYGRRGLLWRLWPCTFKKEKYTSHPWRLDTFLAAYVSL
jgi:hypothetical protein